jgi:hypothetical protein
MKTSFRRARAMESTCKVGSTNSAIRRRELTTKLNENLWPSNVDEDKTRQSMRTCEPDARAWTSTGTKNKKLKRADLRSKSTRRTDPKRLSATCQDEPEIRKRTKSSYSANLQKNSLFLPRQTHTCAFLCSTRTRQGRGTTESATS